jgi:multiple antibiotic resistance protein
MRAALRRPRCRRWRSARLAGILDAMDALSFFYKALAALFTIIDPIGLVPVVLGITAGMGQRARALTVTRAVIIAAIVIAIFGTFGRVIFAALGVSSPAFNIAGGVLLFLIAIDMLFGRPSGARETAREADEAAHADDVSVFPLAIPMIAGPGTITAIILLVNTASGDPIKLGAVAIAGALTLLVAWLTMLGSGLIQQRIGTTGILVLSRVLGMLLAAVAAQFILNGLTAFMQGGAAPLSR